MGSYKRQVGGAKKEGRQTEPQGVKGYNRRRNDDDENGKRQHRTEPMMLDGTTEQFDERWMDGWWRNDVNAFIE